MYRLFTGITLLESRLETVMAVVEQAGTEEEEEEEKEKKRRSAEDKCAEKRRHHLEAKCFSASPPICLLQPTVKQREHSAIGRLISSLVRAGRHNVRELMNGRRCTRK